MILKKLSIKKMKLAAKMSLIIGIILLLIFASLIGVTLSISKNAVHHAIMSEFIQMSRGNGLEVQQIFNTAQGTVSDLQSYMKHYYEIEKAQQNNQSGVEQQQKNSVVYANALSINSFEVENYFLNTAWSSVSGNEAIAGIGFYFEPNKFSNNIKDYAIYISKTDAEKRTAQAEGAYSEYSTKEYYEVAAKTKKPYVTKPYEDQGILMVTVSYPIILDNQVQGIIIADINIETFEKLKSTNEKYPSMYGNIVTNEGYIIYDSESADDIGANMKSFYKNPQDYENIMNGFEKGEAFNLETVREDGRSVSRFLYPIHAGEVNWWSQTVLDTNELNQDVTSLITMMTIFSVIALAIIITITIIVLRRIIKPISGILIAASDIAKGNLDVKIETKNQDEIGILANTFVEMADNLKEIIEDINYQLGEMSDGNFRVHTQCQEKYVGEYKNILNAVNGINGNLSNILLQINQSADQVSSGSDQVSSGAQALSQGATEQASSIEELSATINEISNQIKTNAEDARIANKLSQEAGAEVQIGNEHMQDMMVAMNEITNTSNQIGKIIKTIDDIAFQTNILALNAAVEAARAGSAGKGFAVVAEEVRNLAGKSAEAAKNTTALIESSIVAVDKGTKIASETAESLLMIVQKASSVNDRIHKITEASVEQANAISQVTQGVEQISAVVQTNSATAEESAAASEELNAQAQMLKELVGNFKIEDNSTNMKNTYSVEKEKNDYKSDSNDYFEEVNKY